MTLSVEQDFQPRVKVRRRRSVLRLRQPELASAPTALGLLYATGLMGMLMAYTGLAGAEATTAGALSAPAGAASVMTALALGPRLHRYRERSQTNLVLRIGCLWAFFGAAWPLLQIAPSIAHGDIATLPQMLESMAAMGLDVLTGGSAGAIGGLMGGAAAVALCVERVR
ncbi:MAG: hypothetical protein NW200_04390 [Hyphomonadaceae bacterium]|nr:hypothetical protein [Hyphomonadaceae bacterium]